ncbi:MAG: argininosuccinate lyase [Spirochaetia bacterium]|nr:argininosuccinate lyase [Spirochaetia bacterium]
MKKKIASIAIAALMITGAAGYLSAESDYDFTLVNGTGYDIDAVFVSPSSTEAWGNDVMGQDVLVNGQAVKIVFHPTAQAASWDLKIKWHDEGYPAVVWHNLDLATINKITLKYNRESGATSIVKE